MRRQGESNDLARRVTTWVAATAARLPSRELSRPSRRALVATSLAVVTTLAALPVLGPPAMGQVTPDFGPPSDATLAEAASRSVEDAPPDLDDLPTLTDVRDGAEALIERLPAEEWDVPALADALDFDPDRAFDFVRDRIAFDPYPGALRGAEGTLAARAGNAVDRALLLSALLDAMAVPNRLALGQLEEDALGRLIERATQPALAPLPRPGLELVPTLDASALLARATRDYGRLRAALGERIAAIAPYDPQVVREALRAHVWVQALVGPEWRDLDPSMLDAEPGGSLTAAEETVDELPDELWHGLVLRVIAGTGRAGIVEEQVVLERQLRAADVASRDLFVVFLPWDSRAGAVITAGLTGEASWVAATVTDGVVEMGGAPFAVGGRGSDVFGDPTAIVELMTLRLSIETRVPGASPTVAERVLLDRTPAGDTPGQAEELEPSAPLAGDETGPFVLAQVHDVLVSTGGADRREFNLRRGAGAEFVGAAVESDLPVEAYDLGSLLWPVAAADRALVIVSEAVNVPALEQPGTHRAYVERPRVTLTTFGRDADDGDLAFATDLLIDGVGLLPVADPSGDGGAEAGEAARLRLWYAALQTALETEVALRRAAILDPAARRIDAVSLDGGGELSVLDPAAASELPTGSPRRLRETLEAGSLVILASDPQEAAGWWAIDARTGEARSVLATGLGGAVPRGRPAVSARVSDTSYTHGRGARLPPRPPMIRPPPGGSRIPAPRPAPAACGPSDSGGYIATMSCVSMVAVGSWILLGVGLAGLVTIWVLILTT